MFDSMYDRIYKKEPLRIENTGMVLHPHSEQMLTDNFRKKLLMLGEEPTMFRMNNNSMFLSNIVGNTMIVEDLDLGYLSFLDEETRYNNWLKTFCRENFLLKNSENRKNKMLPHYTIENIEKDTVYYRKNNGEVETISLLYLRDEVLQGKCYIVNPIKFVESIKEDKLMDAIRNNILK